MSTQGVSRNVSIFSIFSSRKPHLAFSHLLSFAKNPIGILAVSLAIIITSTLAVQIVQQKNIASKPIIQELSSSFFDIQGKTNISAVQNINDPWSEKGVMVNISASNSADMDTDLEIVPEDEEIGSPTPTVEETTVPPTTITLSPNQYVAPDEATITIIPTSPTGIEISPTLIPNTIVQEVGLTVSDTSPSPTPESSVTSIPERQNLEVENSKMVNEQSPNRVIVKFKKFIQVSPNTVGNVTDFADKYNMEATESMPSMQIAVLDTGVKPLEQAIQELRNDPMVEKVEPDYIQHIVAIPNDTNFTYQWGLHNIGQTVNGVVSTTDKDIDAPEAWNVETAEQTDTIVAVIDSGVAIRHPDLIGNMWDGSSCKDINNLPVAGGCPNNGWDFTNSDNNPSDDNGHGTHIAGIIAATANNSRGVAGTSMYNNIKIMALKVGNSQGSIYTSAVLSAINFAKYNGANVINASFGGGGYSQIYKDVIDQFPGLFIAAAGNGGGDGVGDDNDITPFYPCSYTSANIVCVTATTQSDSLASFSNYGASSVDVGAPGTNIYSSYISPTTVNNQTFESITPPNMPAGWTRNTSGTVGMGTYSFGAGQTVLYGDAFSMPYGSSKDYQAYSTTLNLSDYQSAHFSLYVRCDTELNHGDFLSLGVSNNAGATYTAIATFDEQSIINDGGSFNSTYAWGYYVGITIPQSYLVNNFKYSLRWYADGDSDKGTIGDGCNIDDIVITGVQNNTETYAFLNGTSMATPYVTGLAAHIFSADPAKTVDGARELILSSGDTIAALFDKTTSNKRINLQSMYSQVFPPPSTPIAVPSGGTHYDTIYVTFTAANSASIRYTTNGTAPHCGSTLYSTSIPIVSNTTIKAVSCSGSGVASSIMTEVYIITTPTQTWYLAEGYNGGSNNFSTEILIQNPGSISAKVNVSYLTQGAGVISRQYTIPATTRFTIVTRNDVPTGTSFSTKISSNSNIVVERSVYWDSNGVSRIGGHNTMGVTSPEYTWYFAEGFNGGANGFWTLILVQNPNSTPATVDVSYMTQGAGVINKQYVVPANARYTITTASDVATGISFSTKVSSNVPVISERVVYWNSGGIARKEGHNSPGMTDFAQTWYTAEGYNGGSSGFSTLILIQNPNDTPSTVNVTYMTSLGAVIEKTYIVPASSRYTINTNIDVSSGTSFSTKVNSSNNVVVEKVMYWNSGIYSRAGGHNAVGYPEL